MPPTTHLTPCPPHAPEAERAVLSCLLMDAAAGMEKILEACPQPGAIFHDPRHRTLFNTLLDLGARNRPCDPVTVSEALNADGHFEPLGGHAFLAGILDSAASPSLLGHYLDILLDRWKRRRLLAGLTQALDKVRQCADGQADTVAAEISESLHTLALTHYQSELTPLEELIRRALLPPGPEEQPVAQTGLPGPDSLLEIRPGHLVVLAARPSVGKTALAVQIALHTARAGPRPVIFFSLEMNASAIAQRLLTAHAQLNPRHSLSLFERQTLAHRAAEISRLPLWIDDSPHLTLPMVQARLRRMAAATPRPALAVVDYLQLLPPGERKPPWRSREEEVAAVSRGLKRIARETRVAVLVCAQLNRDLERNGTPRPPRLSDLRESGAIEQDADTVLLLHPEDAAEAREATVRLRLIVEKQREGPTGVTRLCFFRPHCRFAPTSEEPVMEPEPASHHEY